MISIVVKPRQYDGQMISIVVKTTWQTDDKYRRQDNRQTDDKYRRQAKTTWQTDDKYRRQAQWIE